jgi:hypothetical protein
MTAVTFLGCPSLLPPIGDMIRLINPPDDKFTSILIKEGLKQSQQIRERCMIKATKSY